MSQQIDAAALVQRVPEMAGKRVLIVGDIMVDEYLVGDAERISPEAPVPVIRVNEDRHVIGGAGNVARNIRSLGGNPHLLCVTGADGGANLLAALLDEETIAHDFIRIKGRQTTRKTRIIASRQQMLRIDREETTPVNGQSLNTLLEQLKELLPQFDVVIVSDYGKGLITDEFMKQLTTVCKDMTNCPKILVDPKTPNFRLYDGVFMLTPNAKETSEGSGMPVSTQEEIIAAGQAIIDTLGCDKLLTTLGPQGMALFEARDNVWRIPTMAREVFDVTGAGDTVIATAALSLASGHSLMDACILANYAAGIVVGHVGAATVTPEDLADAIAQAPSPDIEKWA